MIKAKEAAEKALIYLRELYPSALSSQILIEEVELTDDNKFWLITLSYIPPTTNPFIAISLASREYKVFKVDSVTSDVVSK